MTAPCTTCDPTFDAHHGPSRRGLLRGAAALGGAVALPPGLSVSVAHAADGQRTGDVLVLLSLRGGFDGLSAVAPLFDPGYAAARPTLAVPASVALPADRGFGLHPAMAPLAPLWAAGQLGAVVAVGQPTGGRSHFAATEELERAAPGTSLRTGWLDRVLGTRGAGRPLQAVAVGTGSPALAGPSPEVVMRSLKDFEAKGDPALTARRLAAGARMHPGTGAVTSARTALAEAARVRSSTPAGTGYPAGQLGGALSDLARMIKTDVGLQFACVDYGDWDHHEDLGTVDDGRFARRLGELSRALAAFAADLGPRMSGVTLVTLSEFGRRVAENGSRGTDHGQGNTVLVMGGGVQGGRVHGTWPGLGRTDLDDGDLAVRTDYRSVLAELLQTRCGVGDVSRVFPGFRPEPVGVARPRG